MSQPTIELRLEQVRRRLRRMVCTHGVGWLVAAAIGIGTVASFADWLLNLTGAVRFVLLVFLAVACVGIVVKHLLIPLFVRFRDVDLALRVEAQYPNLDDELSSAVEFSSEPAESDRSGSPALRAAVVDHATRRAIGVDFDAVLDWAAPRRALAGAAAVLAVAFALVLVSPASARIAATRLVLPFGGTAWPRQTHLALADMPLRLARGEPFSLQVEVVRGRVPDRAEVFYEFEGGDRANEPLQSHGERKFVGGMEAVSRSFSFHVRAGDGVSEARHVEVVPAPELDRLQVRLTYPAYTGQPPEDLPPDKGQVRAVWGTRVAVTARASKPLATAALRIGGDTVIPAALSADGAELEASFTLESSDSYWIAIRDRDGFENRQASRYELKMVEDTAPEVFIERPPSDIEVTPSAEVPLRVSIKDDFGIADATLVHSAETSDAPSEMTIWQPEELSRRHVLDFVWKIAELDLSPGATVTYRVRARDRDDLRGPHVGQSRALRLLVVTPQELARRLEDRQSIIYQELERLRGLQADARQQVSELKQQLETQPALAKNDLARLQSAEMLQRQVERRITSPTEGLQNQVAQIQQDMANNQLADSVVTEQLDAVAAGLESIARDELPQIARHLNTVRKGTESAPDRDEQSTGLEAARDSQDAVLATLDRLLEQMSKWETYRGIARDVRDLQEHQEQLAGQTAETARETIGKPREALTPDQQAQLARLGSRQDQSREQLGRVERKMEQMAARLGERDPAAADMLRQALDTARQAGTAEQMQRASANLQQNQVGAAEAAQRQAAEDLKDMLDTLENRQEMDLAKLVEKLKQAEAKLSDLRRRQLEQLERTQDSRKMPDAEQRRRELERLARQEKELQQETARLAQQLRRLRAERASKSSASASGRMSQAGQQMQQGDGEAAAAEQQRVLEDLERAEREVAQARREAEAQLAMEQLARIADTLVALHDRQKSVHEETARLETSRQKQGNWTRPQLASLRSTSEAQKTVRSDTDQARDVLTAAPVFALTLRRAMNHMERAVELLDERRADAETQSAQVAALDRLAQLLESLKNEPADENQPSQNGEESGGGQGGPPRDGIPPIAQLRLLRSLQIELNDRTRELHQIRDTDQKLSPAQQKELVSLGEEQGVLADLVREFQEAGEEGAEP